MITSITEQLIHNTIRIESFFEKGSGTGTGFFFEFNIGDKSVPCIITNKHVVKDKKLGDAKRGRLILKLKNSTGNWDTGNNFTVDIDNFIRSWIMHPEEQIDLCIYPIAPLLQEISVQGKSPFFISIQESLIPTVKDEDIFAALEEIVMVGYPNGIWDSKNNLHILRRGITATSLNHNYNGRYEFLIDAACFPGSSGSPVFLLNLNGYSDKEGNSYFGSVRLKFLGVLYAGPQHTADGHIQIVDVPIIQKQVPIITIPNNLGFVIKSKKIQDFKDILQRLIE